MIVDVHSHAMDEQMLLTLAEDESYGFTSVIRRDSDGGYTWLPYGKIDSPLYELPVRLASLRQRGIDRQLVGMWPPFLSGPAAGASVAFSRLANECLHRVVNASGGVLSGLAVIAFGDPDKMTYELERAVDKHGFVGVMLGTSIHGQPLDAEPFASIFSTIEKLGLLIFMHSSGGFDRAALRDYSMRVLVGFPGETSLAVGRLIFSGILERHPRLKLVLSHGGGTLPYLRGRLDLGYNAQTYERNDQCTRNITRPPSSYLRQIYFDTLVADADVLDFLVRSYGADHVLLGTDYPFEIGDPEAKHALPAIDRMSAHDQSLILGGNAMTLLAGQYR